VALDRGQVSARSGTSQGRRRPEEHDVVEGCLGKLEEGVEGKPC
jgi:hypothetical protein